MVLASLTAALILTEGEDRTGEYWPEVVAVRTERTQKTIDGQYSPLRLELARLVCSLLYGARMMLVLNLPAFKSKTKTVRMAKSRPRKSASGERSDLPQDLLAI